MEKYLNNIFAADSIHNVCVALQLAMGKLRANGYLNKLPNEYDAISADHPEDVQNWFDYMLADQRAQEEGNLREVKDLFDAALRQLRRYGFHRN